MSERKLSLDKSEESLEFGIWSSEFGVQNFALLYAAFCVSCE